MSDKVTNLKPEDLKLLQDLDPHEQYVLFENYMEKSGAKKFGELLQKAMEDKKFKGDKETFPKDKLEAFKDEVKAYFDSGPVRGTKMLDIFKGFFKKGVFQGTQSVFMDVFKKQGTHFEKWYGEDWEKKKKIYDAEVEKANRVKSDERKYYLEKFFTYFFLNSHSLSVLIDNGKSIFKFSTSSYIYKLSKGQLP